MIGEIKELRDRFPKEKFMDKSPEEYEKIVRDTNLKYINQLKKGVNKDEDIVHQVQEKLSIGKPMNQLLKSVEEERKSFINHEDNKDLITLQRFYEQGINSETIKRTHDDYKTYHHSITAQKLKDLERERVRLLRENPPEKLDYVQNEKEETYSEYLARKKAARKKMNLERKEKEKALEVQTTSQFNPNDLTLEHITTLTCK